MTVKDTFLGLVSKEETKTIDRAKARLAQKGFLKLSKMISIKILARLDELGWKQVDLAKRMGVTPQQVNKWIKGKENFTLETLVKISDILGIELITVPIKPQEVHVKEIIYQPVEKYEPTKYKSFDMSMQTILTNKSGYVSEFKDDDKSA